MASEIPLAETNIDEKEATQQHPQKSLGEVATDGILRKLSRDMYRDGATTRYCCGGQILISNGDGDDDDDDDDKSIIISQPIIIRFDDPTDPGLARKVEYPLLENDISIVAHDQLLEACGMSDTLDATSFSTNFHPHEYSILDSINQILEPETDLAGVKVELSHLHIASEYIIPAPLRDSIPYADSIYVGKLVVCLPHSHEGGQLLVSSDDYSTLFDWNNAEAVQWAAFDIDCNYEFHPVHNGTRIFFVYHILRGIRVGWPLTSPQSNTDPTQFPLYEVVRRLLEKPAFMQQGGTLGFYCLYDYAHTQPGAAERMPDTLRGVDLIIYIIFQTLGCKAYVRPVLDPSSLEWWAEMDEECPNLKAWPPMIGKDLHQFDTYITHQASGDELEDVTKLKQAEENLQEAWPYKYWEDVRWVNERDEELRELAAIETHYSEKEDYSITISSFAWLAILVKVPKWLDRDLERGFASSTSSSGVSLQRLATGIPETTISRSMSSP